MKKDELKEFKEEIKGFDFFREGKDDFYGGKVTQSDLVCGAHWEKTPMITVIILTYKRPKLLRQALESALNQANFTDYQIMVVDNAGIPLEQETETSILMQSYRNNDKIIYYRNRSAADYRMDTAINYARSKWVCFLHDDDLLVGNHLAIMSNIVKSHHEIPFLGCPAKAFYNDIDDNEYAELVKPVKGSFLVVHYPYQYLSTGYVPGWVGALIDREKYIAIGGVPGINTGIGDFITQGKFMRKWGVYHYEASHSLYCYRVWKGQASAKGESVWLKGYLAEYYWYKYLNNKIHFRTQKFWNRVSAYRIIRKCVITQNNYGIEINMERLKEYCEWDEDIMENNLKKKWCLKIEELYKSVYYHVAHYKCIHGEVDGNAVIVDIKNR